MKITIKEGVVKGFKDEMPEIITKSDLKVETIETKRVSHIYPKKFFQRIVFKVLRKIFGDNGKVAEWTRNWKCEWIVYIPSVGYFGPYKDRKKAIKVEKELIWRLGIK